MSKDVCLNKYVCMSKNVRIQLKCVEVMYLFDSRKKPELQMIIR